MNDDIDLSSSDESSTDLEVQQVWNKLKSIESASGEAGDRSDAGPPTKKQKAEAQLMHCPRPARIIPPVGGEITQRVDMSLPSEKRMRSFKESPARKLSDGLSSSSSSSSESNQPNPCSFVEDMTGKNSTGAAATYSDERKGCESGAPAPKTSDKIEAPDMEYNTEATKAQDQLPPRKKHVLSAIHRDPLVNESTSNNDGEGSTSLTCSSESNTSDSSTESDDSCSSSSSDSCNSIIEAMHNHPSTVLTLNIINEADTIAGMEVEIPSHAPATIPATSSGTANEASNVETAASREGFIDTADSSLSRSMVPLKTPVLQNPYIKTKSFRGTPTLKSLDNLIQLVSEETKCGGYDEAKAKNRPPTSQLGGNDDGTLLDKSIGEHMPPEMDCIDRSSTASRHKKATMKRTSDENHGNSKLASFHLNDDDASVKRSESNDKPRDSTNDSLDIPAKEELLQTPVPRAETSNAIIELPPDPNPCTVPEPEVHFAMFAPPPYKEKPPPVLFRFSENTHPARMRRKVPVTSLFSLPVNLLWKYKFDHFNEFQTETSNLLCHSDDHVVVSAPTGAGKSTIFEMAMARFITMDLQAQVKLNQQHAGQRQQQLSKARKIVYVAPSKALCEERYKDWCQRLHNLKLGIEVALITGDSIDPGSSFGDLVASHLILTTPEKWDSMTRRWTENFFLIASVKLILVDEIHHLGDETRGWCLESVLCRMKTVHRAAQFVASTPADIRKSSYPGTNLEAIQSSFRMVAVSATLPNISDVADFLGANEAYAFDDSYRPVPLTKHVNGLGNVGKNEWRFWSNLDEHVPEIIQRFSHGKQSLIFCHTKNATQKIADMLIRRRSFGNRNVQTSAAPGTVQYFLDHGVGYHHAGMEKDDRQRIEVAFAEGKIRCLAATSTLAVGVNLPAHLVLVVGTRAWRGGGSGYQDIEISSLLQMVGRAGRPGLDSNGVAVVMTDNDSKKKVERLLESGLGPAKSKMLSRLSEVLNNEISQRVVTSREGTLHWLKTSFLFACMEPGGDTMISMERIRDDTLKELKECGLLEEFDHGSIVPLPGCHVMNQRMLSFEVLKAIASWSFDTTQYQILRSISKLEPFQYPVRRNEKKELKEVHKTEKVKHKLPGALSKFCVQDPSDKAFILLQCIISQHEFSNVTLRQEMASITNDAVKILEAAQDYCSQVSKSGGILKQCYKLHRSIYRCLWGESSGVLNQIEDLGVQSVNLLRFNGILSFQHALACPEEVLAQYIGRQISFVKGMKAEISKLIRDRLKLSAEIEYTRSSNIPAGLICDLTFEDITRSMRTKGEPMVTFSLIVYTDNPENSLLIFQEDISSASSYRVALPRSFGKIHVHLIGTFVGFDQSIVLNGTGTNFQQNRQSPEALVTTEAGQRDRSHSFTRNDPMKENLHGSRPFAKGDTQNEQRISPKHLSLTSQLLKPLNESNGPNASDPSPTITPLKREINTINTLRRHEEIFFEEKSLSEIRHSQDIFMETSVGHRSCHDRIAMSPRNLGPDHFLGIARQRHNIASQASPVNVTPIMNQGIGRVRPHRFELPGRSVPQDTVTSPLQADDFTVASIARNGNLQQDRAKWDRVKKKQENHQKRAFTKKGENPFVDYRHDPNDAEALLEGFSHRSGIIPAGELEDSASNRRGGVTRHTFHKRRLGANAGNRTLTDRELLAQKALEHRRQQNLFRMRDHRPNNQVATAVAYGGRKYQENLGIQRQGQFPPTELHLKYEVYHGISDMPAQNIDYCSRRPESDFFHSEGRSQQHTPGFSFGNVAHGLRTRDARHPYPPRMDLENRHHELDQEILPQSGVGYYQQGFFENSESDALPLLGPQDSAGSWEPHPEAPWLDSVLPENYQPIRHHESSWLEESGMTESKASSVRPHRGTNLACDLDHDSGDMAKPRDQRGGVYQYFRES